MAGNVRRPPKGAVKPAENREGEFDIAVFGLRPAATPVRTLNLRIPSRLETLRSLRIVLRQWLEEEGITGADADDLVLAAWEAGINAVEHPRAATSREVELSAESREGEVTIVVRDTGHWREPVETGDRGRGLRLIKGVVDSLSVRSGTEGTEVRFRRVVPQRRRTPPLAPSTTRGRANRPRQDSRPAR